MDPVLMAGAWAGALLAIIGLSRIAWKAFVAAVEAVIEKAISRVWADMDHIESRLDRLEQQVADLREQVLQMRELLMGYVAELGRGE